MPSTIWLRISSAASHSTATSWALRFRRSRSGTSSSISGTAIVRRFLHADVWYPGGGAIFAVKDLDAAVRRLKDAGVKFYTDGAIESPVCRIAWCEDSEGNTFAIHKLK